MPILDPPPDHLRERLQQRIRDELALRRQQAQRDPLPLVMAGSVERALEGLLFFSAPESFRRAGAELPQRLQSAYATATPDQQAHLLRFCAELAIGLNSLLPAWNLAHPSVGLDTLTWAELRSFARAYRDLAGRLCRSPSIAADKLLEAWRVQTAARFRAEAANDPEAEARAFVGTSVPDYIEAIGAAVEGSNLRRIAELRWQGATRSEISNDYAAFLPYTLLLGASFVTCNPPLVDLAWKAEPEVWDPVVDRLLASRPEADPDSLARTLTLEIVLANMRLLRPIFLLTEGRMGFVSLQVHPGRHDDADSMIADARVIHHELEARLDGGVPNVVFKLPATRAGLEACSALVAEGIGVNITVNFGLFQHVTFAEVIQSGKALLGVLSHMSGRLAFPVRDELLARMDELNAMGISEVEARLAAAWSGVAVLKRLHSYLSRRAIHPDRVRPLIASLRVYSDSAYAALPSPIPDITEALGTGIITVFPNVRRAFDLLPHPLLDGHRVEAPVPESALDVLQHSEIFKQAYWLPPPAADEPDLEALRPKQPLSLQDRLATANWAPVANTLNEFCKAYDSFVERILARRARAG